jgi:hypothetical protein
MKTRVLILLISVSSIILCGCPYDSKVPLEQPSVKVDRQLAGQWRDISDTTEIYEIEIRDSVSYNVEVRKTNKLERDHYIVYMSRFANATFFNVREDKGDGSASKFLFFKMTWSGKNKIVLSTVTENIREQFTSSAELKKFFTNNMHNSYFFEKGETTLVRL